MERKRAGERECCWRGRELFGLWSAREGLAGVFIEAGFKVPLYNYKLYIYLKQKVFFLIYGNATILVWTHCLLKSNIYKVRVVLLCYWELYCLFYFFCSWIICLPFLDIPILQLMAPLIESMISNLNWATNLYLFFLQ